MAHQNNYNIFIYISSITNVEKHASYINIYHNYNPVLYIHSTNFIDVYEAIISTPFYEVSPSPGIVINYAKLCIAVYHYHSEFECSYNIP